MQALVPFYARHPDNHIIRPISSCHPRRAPAALTHAPGEYDRRRICRGNPIASDRAAVAMKTKIRSLAGVVHDSRRPSVNAKDISLGHR